MWWRRRTQRPVADEWLRAFGIMLMEIDAKLERALEILEDDDGGQEEAETD